MLYRSYKLAPLFFKDLKNTCSICYVCDFTKVCGFIRFDELVHRDFLDIKELLETRYGLTLTRHSRGDLSDITKHIANKVIQYRVIDKFTVAKVVC
jgi:hypothetical protein